MTQLASLSSTSRTQLTRRKHRAATDRAVLYDVLDKGLVCHLGLMMRETYTVLPTGYGREGNTLYIHGSSGATSMITGGNGIEVCVTVTLLDAIVYARSLNNHSMNYRSAVIYGAARPITERESKMHALRVVSDHLAPGAWQYARDVNAKEFASVSVLAVDLDEASVKIRAQGPSDDEEDIEDNRVWAGVLPLHTTFGEPVASDDLPEGFEIPEHITERVSKPVHR